MGEVDKAHAPRLGRFVAVKILLARDLAGMEQRRRFVQEARAASALNHPGIVTIYDVGSEGGVDYIAMEFVKGKTLDSSANDLSLSTCYATPPRQQIRSPKLIPRASSTAISSPVT